MSDTTQPGIGHNEPPVQTPFERARELVENANRWSAERPVIENAEQAGVAQAFGDQLLMCRRQLEDAQKAEREPLDREVAAIRMKYRDPLELVGIALNAMRARSGVWLRKEQERNDAEYRAQQEKAAAVKAEAERLAREAAQPGATVEAELAAKRASEDAAKIEKQAAKAPDRAAVRGDYSSRAQTLRTTWHAKVTDETAALRTYAKHPDVRKAALVAALKVANEAARKAKSADAAPNGFEFYPTDNAY